MRIRITGEKSLIGDLSAELAREGVPAEAVETSADSSELRLGLIEWAAILAIVANVAKLIEYLMAIVRHLKEGEKRRLEVKSAAAMTLLEIRRGTTREELAKQLAPHQPQGGAATAPAGTPDDDGKKD